ncbi:fatty acid desaturase 6-like [Gigantopelta aegis]|uniref:fatty acid desaturase 6-like n=1 Tax=Gigantopelta aegis TaxID=1735272 RepID=UPI001B88B931|nr:fatty acid desaturase 6-like [Gigantopelta aegis]
MALDEKKHDVILTDDELSRKVIDGTVSGNEVTILDYVNLKKLPEFADLNTQVTAIVNQSSWWELYGIDWLVTLQGVLGSFLAYWLMGLDSILYFGLGIVLLGICHSVLATKAGHCAAHGAFCVSPAWNRFWTVFFVEFIGSFSADVAVDIHIKSHHPHTNIIGMGDSSTFRMPMIPCIPYLFITPLCVPILTPVVGALTLLDKPLKLIRMLIIVILGLSTNIYFMTTISGLSLWQAVICTFVSRSIMGIPYIHINIFQHIGLPMYSRDNRPKRIYLMSTAVLNLPRNIILDRAFGHGIINCHVEHHLFPRLSDNMCLTIKPIVSSFLKNNGLPYNEKTYLNRLKLFVNKYEELMVNAPPITHFVGLQ